MTNADPRAATLQILRDCGSCAPAPSAGLALAEVLIEKPGPFMIKVDGRRPRHATERLRRERSAGWLRPVEQLAQVDAQFLICGAVAVAVQVEFEVGQDSDADW